MIVQEAPQTQDCARCPNMLSSSLLRGRPMTSEPTVRWRPFWPTPLSATQRLPNTIGSRGSLRHATLAYGDLESAKYYEALHAWGFGPLDQYGDLTLFRAAKRLSSEELCSKLYAGELRAADVMKPPFVDRRDRVSERLRSKCIDEERELREALVDKLLRGEVHATAFATNHALDSPAAAIPPDRWRILRIPPPSLPHSESRCGLASPRSISRPR